MDNSFKITAFYTVNTPYEKVVEEYLRPSLEELELDYWLEPVVTKGSWQKNTSYKPTFALEMLDKYKDKNIVILDVDCRVKQYPELFNHIPEEFNIACHILDWHTHYGTSNKKELLTGTLFLRNSDRTRYLVNEWKYACERTQVWEQMVLEDVLGANSEPLFELPRSYCYIDTLPNGYKPFQPLDNTTITHYQKSRELRNCV